jgi:UDP-N-acetylglucosamine--N-acetylmuramyl-(pentapeptide) pyrophosphoryl-undecaprenol N-acetylglucosamine transferase
MKVAIACGGSGGHIFPALGLAQELRTRHSESDLLFITTKYRKEDLKLIAQKGFNCVSLPLSAMPRRLGFSWGRFLLGLSASIIKSLFILGRYNPHVIVGFGGYASTASVFAACLLKVPRIIHEQNISPGLANRCLAKLASKIAISFQETERFFSPSKTFLTGNPLRQTLFTVQHKASLEKFRFRKDRFTILVMGGSLGCRRINQVFLKALRHMNQYLKSKLQIVHISGDLDYSGVCASYAGLEVTARIYPFLEDIGPAYKVANLVISRAGAGTISEIASFGLPSILIPHPNPQTGQLENAQFLEKRDAAVLIYEESFNWRLLLSVLEELINDRKRLKIVSENIRALGTRQGAGRFAEQILRLISDERN